MDTWSLFSNPHNTYYFDMGWVRLFYWYGIIPGIVVVVCLLLLLVYFYKRDKMSEMILFSTYSVYTIVEAHIVSVYIGRNYLLFIAGMYLWKMWSETRKQDEQNWKYYNTIIRAYLSGLFYGNVRSQSNWLVWRNAAVQYYAGDRNAVIPSEDCYDKAYIRRVSVDWCITFHKSYCVL